MTARLGLGIDAGGTRTRWALATAAEGIVAEGEVRGMSALHAREERHVRETLAELAAGVFAHGRPVRVHAGLTGFGENIEVLRALFAESLSLTREAVTLGSDIEIAYLDAFAPGEGYVVYAGTGSVAAFIDAEGALHRAGGRGAILDDGGGGFWIAREALRHVWRLEDEQPGRWQASPMAIAVFEQVGGSDWALTRQYVNGRDRGEMGRLALAVARAADEDPVARDILAAAGRELARLALALTQRHGPRPIALTGRAAQLHRLVGEAMRAALPEATHLEARASRGHHAAARVAVRATREA